MATQPKTTGLTYQDLVEMFPEQDMVRRDLIDGELFVTPSASVRHQRVVRRLLIILSDHAAERGGEAFGSPLDVFFTKENVLQPDVLYVRQENLAKLEERFVRSAPDLVVEVSSPSTRKRDLGLKKEIYERYGVSEYWFVDLDSDRIEVYRLQKGRFDSPELVTRAQILSSALLPGFEASVEELLGPPPA